MHLNAGRLEETNCSWGDHAHSSQSLGYLHGLHVTQHATGERHQAKLHSQ
jgi:hypothetical protein